MKRKNKKKISKLQYLKLKYYKEDGTRRTLEERRAWVQNLNKEFDSNLRSFAAKYKLTNWDVKSYKIEEPFKVKVCELKNTEGVGIPLDKLSEDEESIKVAEEIFTSISQKYYEDRMAAQVFTKKEDIKDIIKGFGVHSKFEEEFMCKPYIPKAGDIHRCNHCGVKNIIPDNKEPTFCKHCGERYW